MFNKASIIFSLLLVVSCGQEIKMPHSKTVQHADNYHGTLVSDPYRWLEDFTSTEVKEWVDQQNTFTETFFS